MTSVLVDSDVLLDLYFDRRPHSEYAERLLTACERGEVQGFVTPVICSNLYYLLCRANPREKVLHQLAQLLRFIQVIGMNHDTVTRAIGSDFKDFEDALQHEAAVAASNISVIITRNVKDYRHSTIAVQTPEQFLKSLHKD